jgi:hypothetical protein
MADTVFKIPKLKGSQNFDIWSLRIESIITKEGFLDFILEDYSSSEQYREQKANLVEPTKLTELDVRASKVTSLIRLSLEDGPLLQTRFIKNPYTLYNTLKNLYCAQGFNSEFILSKELINTTINTYKGNLELYINAFKRILNNLEAKGINLPSNFTAALLLNNLNKDYEYIVTIITQTIRVNNSAINIDSLIAIYLILKATRAILIITTLMILKCLCKLVIKLVIRLNLALIIITIRILSATFAIRQGIKIVLAGLKIRN